MNAPQETEARQLARRFVDDYLAQYGAGGLDAADREEFELELEAAFERVTAELREELQEAQADIDSLTEELSSLRDENTELYTENDKLAKELKDAHAANAELEAKNV